MDGINLRVEPGEIYGFLGPNGAGKSTTVLMLTTLLPPTSGTARVAGFDVAREGPKVRAVIGAALQEAALDPFLTGREHLSLQAALHGLSRKERKWRGDELLERVGLTEAADRRVRGYSGGMKRRLDLALALVHETVFLTTQYLEEADVLADRVGIIDRGKIVAEGTPEELKAEIGRPSVEATPAEGSGREVVASILSRFGEEIAAQPGAVSVRLDQGAGDLADVVRALDSEGVRVTNLRLDEPSLDDVFLEKTGRSLEGQSGAEQEGDSGGSPEEARA